MISSSVMSSNGTKIDEMLAPIIDIVHKNKIHSYHQLKFYQKNKFNFILHTQNSHVFYSKPINSTNHTCRARIYSETIDINKYQKSERILPKLSWSFKKTFQNNQKLVCDVDQ
jgi:hypothetical protein